MQLDLLTWTPPRKVIAFPMAKRIGKVRHTAEILASKQSDAARAYWRQVCGALSAQMDRAGIPADERDVELRAFFDAVQAELNRLAYRGQRPGGAA